MGMLTKAEHKKHKKPHEAPPSDEESGEPADSGEDENAEADGNAQAGGEGSPDAQPDDASPQGGADAAGSVQQPPGEDDESGEAPDDEGAEKGPEPDSSGGAGEGDDGAQGASPEGDEGQGQDSAAGDEDQVDLSKLPISPGLKHEYQKANAALMTALYTNDKVAQSVLGGLQPQGPHKIESVVHMAVTLFLQLNKKLGFIKAAPQIALPFMKDVVAHVSDLATQVKQIQFSPPEEQAILASAIELVMRVVGVTKSQMDAARQHIPHSQQEKGMNDYKAHLAATKGVGVHGGQNPGDQAPPQGGQPANGGPPAAGGAGAQPGPTGGAGGTPGGQPQPGAPVTAAPGPGQSAPPGGMLTQAAAPQGA